MLYQVKPSYIHYVNPYLDINLTFVIETDKNYFELKKLLMKEARRHMKIDNIDSDKCDLIDWEKYEKTFKPFGDNFSFSLRSCYEGNIGFIVEIEKINKLKIV